MKKVFLSKTNGTVSDGVILSETKHSGAYRLALGKCFYE